MTYKQSQEMVDKLKKELAILRKCFYNYDDTLDFEKIRELKTRINKLTNEIKFIENLRKATQNENIKTRGI